MNITSWTLVDGKSSLEKARKDIESVSLLGVDTEYDSFRYFREKLCLLQISTDSTVYLFDPLSDVDFSFLGTVLENSGVLKVFHACDNDVRLLNRDHGFTFSSIFDTHRAAALLGSTSLSLPALLREYLGIEAEKEKKIQRSRWDVRPLGENQLDYAARDAGCLIPLYRAMAVWLREQGLEGAAEKAFKEIAAGRWREKRLSPHGYTKMEGYNNLDERGRERLKALYRWRFEKARNTNRARFMILSDRNLVDMAGHEFNSLETLKASGLLSKLQVRELGKEILRVLEFEPGKS